MATAATIGTGCSFSVDPAGGTTYAAVGEVDSFTLSMDCGEVEATSFDSNGQQQWIPGMLSSNVQVGGNFIPGTQNAAGTAIYTNFQGGTKTSWKLAFNDATPASIAGKGFIADLSTNVAGPDQVNTFSLTMQDNGEALPTLAGFATI